MSQDVQDKPAEVSLKVSNILQFLVLGVMSWVGFNIQTMGRDISEIRTDLAVSKTEISHIAAELDAHKADKYAHNYYVGGSHED